MDMLWGTIALVRQHRLFGACQMEAFSIMKYTLYSYSESKTRNFIYLEKKNPPLGSYYVFYSDAVDYERTRTRITDLFTSGSLSEFFLIGKGSLQIGRPAACGSSSQRTVPFART
jgi:hypothetical protein